VTGRAGILRDNKGKDKTKISCHLARLVPSLQVAGGRPRSVTSPAKPITPVQGRQTTFPPRLAASIPLELGGD
jgi:hypothetical protein